VKDLPLVPFPICPFANETEPCGDNVHHPGL
jgi:hypothetical protein